MKLNSLALAAITMAPCAAKAHPHIFVDTALKVLVMDDGQLEAVEVTWAYDEFYSLLIFEDLGLDADYDGELTAEELVKLQSFDLQWSEDYDGDSYLIRDGVPLVLSGAEHLETVVSGGRITTRHRRTLVEPVAADGVVFKAYDPTYYTAYTLNLDFEVTGGCTGEATPPNLNAAYDKVEELLYSIPADQVNEVYPEVGEAFAETVRLSCGDW